MKKAAILLTLLLALTLTACSTDQMHGHGLYVHLDGQLNNLTVSVNDIVRIDVVHSYHEEYNCDWTVRPGYGIDCNEEDRNSVSLDGEWSLTNSNIVVWGFDIYGYTLTALSPGITDVCFEYYTPIAEERMYDCATLTIEGGDGGIVVTPLN